MSQSLCAKSIIWRTQWKIGDRPLAIIPSAGDRVEDSMLRERERALSTISPSPQRIYCLLLFIIADTLSVWHLRPFPISIRRYERGRYTTAVWRFREALQGQDVDRRVLSALWPTRGWRMLAALSCGASFRSTVLLFLLFFCRWLAHILIESAADRDRWFTTIWHWHLVLQIANPWALRFNEQIRFAMFPSIPLSTFCKYLLQMARFELATPIFNRMGFALFALSTQPSVRKRFRC